MWLEFRDKQVKYFNPNKNNLTPHHGIRKNYTKPIKVGDLVICYLNEQKTTYLDNNDLNNENGYIPKNLEPVKTQYKYSEQHVFKIVELLPSSFRVEDITKLAIVNTHDIISKKHYTLHKSKLTLSSIIAYKLEQDDNILLTEQIINNLLIEEYYSIDTLSFTTYKNLVFEIDDNSIKIFVENLDHFKTIFSNILDFPTDNIENILRENSQNVYNDIYNSLSEILKIELLFYKRIGGYLTTPELKLDRDYIYYNEIIQVLDIISIDYTYDYIYLQDWSGYSIDRNILNYLEEGNIVRVLISGNAPYLKILKKLDTNKYLGLTQNRYGKIYGQLPFIFGVENIIELPVQFEENSGLKKYYKIVEEKNRDHSGEIYRDTNEIIDILTL
jgi:hypothetical protein